MPAKNIDLTIIGGGIAGISAAIYSHRAGLNPIIFEKNVLGGQLLYIDTVDNYPAVYPHTPGIKFVDVLNSTLQEFKVNFINESVEKVELSDNGIVIYSENDTYLSQALIIATGAKPKRLGIEGEDLLIGKGVSFCAICDGFFFKDKDVAVVGGGNSAVEEALYLSHICKKVYLIHRRDKLRALDYLQKELFSKNNVELVWNTTVEKIYGEGRVEGVVLKNLVEDKKINFSVSAVFIAIGIEPVTEIFKSIVDTDRDGYIITDEWMHTSRKLIYACGDCRRRPLRQLITAASEGAIAGLSAYKDLRGNYISQ
ncbi:MAG: thioredoxin-disulfide reductase [Candidatus Omnitrophica bacterium]|nr:thioredoxin-disulfide reductase [Candidatus Omnitrophota bacterium]MCM8826020.1 thioredoxin-disulfide reductase [Candidatus Omnitrophota bacterium]